MALSMAGSDGAAVARPATLSVWKLPAVTDLASGWSWRDGNTAGRRATVRITFTSSQTRRDAPGFLDRSPPSRGFGPDRRFDRNPIATCAQPIRNRRSALAEVAASISAGDT